MDVAAFGRIRLGRCITSDLMLGCVVDVLDLVDRLCSGKSDCSMFVPSPGMTDRLHCLQDRSFRGAANIEVSYHCKKGQYSFSFLLK